MQGIVSEMEEDLEDFGGGPAGDAVLIGCAQAVEHYEMTRYGTLIAWAKKLGRADCASVLEKNLKDEKDTDAKLTRLAEAEVNRLAA